MVSTHKILTDRQVALSFCAAQNLILLYQKAHCVYGFPVGVMRLFFGGNGFDFDQKGVAGCIAMKRVYD